MRKIHLSGGDSLLTKTPGTAYRVLAGRVLVFVVPTNGEEPGARRLLYEAGEGEVLPSFCAVAPYELGSSKTCPWYFALCALESAQLAELDGQNNDALCADFAARCRLRGAESLGFTEAVLEFYRLELARNMRNIYQAEREQTQSREQGLRVIFDLFRPRNKATPAAAHTGNALYDACACICAKMRIDIAPLENIRQSAGKQFDIYDIARVSHFICREVMLDNRWFRSDCGPLLVWREKDGRPIACIPKGPGKYLAIDPATGEQQRVTQSVAAQFRLQAQMLYRPFPDKAIGLRDMMAFGLHQVYTRDIVWVLLLALAGALIGLLLPYINEQVYDRFIPMGDGTALVQVCCVVLAATLGNVTFSIVKNLSGFRSINAMKYSLQSAVYDRLYNLPQSFFRHYESADLAGRAMGISTIFQQLANVIVSVGLTAFFSLFYLWRMYKYSKKLFWFSLVMVALGMGLIAFLGYRQTRLERSKMELDGKISSLLYQLLGGISKIRIAGVEDRALYEYLKPYTRSRALNMRKERYTVYTTMLTTALPTVFSIILYYVMIRNKLTLSIGAFMGFTTAFGSFSQAMLSLVSSFLQVNNILPAFDRIRPILETLPETGSGSVLPGELTGEIEVSHVTFGYDSETGPVLHDINLHIAPGEYVGIVGTSGCGKSTLLKLLLGFEQPQQGKIYYNGRDIDAMDKRELRKKFGVVLQNGGLIAGSIYENITITAPKIKRSEVEQAVTAVGLADDIAAMPMGLNTVVAEGAGTISGGQQQRILIARAIVNKPKILFFDEATSALDNVTQAQVCESLEKLHATRIVVAHRLSTVMHCDRILVMDAGRVIEQGSYEELMQKKGAFYQLAARQIV